MRGCLARFFFSRDFSNRPRLYVLHTPHPGRKPSERPNVRTTRPSKTHSLSVGSCRSVGARAGSTVPPPKSRLRSSIERKKPGSAPSPSNTRVCGEDLLTHVSGIAQALVWSRLRHHTSKILSKVLFGRAPDQDVATNCGVRRAPLGETRDARHVRRPPSSSRANARRTAGLLARAARPTELADPPPRARFRFRPPDPRVRDRDGVRGARRVRRRGGRLASPARRAARLAGRPRLRVRRARPAASRPKNTKDSYMLFHPQYDLDAIADITPRHRPPRGVRDWISFGAVQARARRLRPHHGLRSG